jgi:hypothetical protein
MDCKGNKFIHLEFCVSLYTGFVLNTNDKLLFLLQCNDNVHDMILFSILILYIS